MEIRAAQDAFRLQQIAHLGNHHDSARPSSRPRQSRYLALYAHPSLPPRTQIVPRSHAMAYGTYSRLLLENGSPPRDWHSNSLDYHSVEMDHPCPPRIQIHQRHHALSLHIVRLQYQSLLYSLHGCLRGGRMLHYCTTSTGREGNGSHLWVLDLFKG